MDTEFFRKKLMQAIKDRDDIAKSCLQILLSAIKNEEIEIKGQSSLSGYCAPHNIKRKVQSLSEGDIVGLIQKEIKQLDEVISIAQSGGRDTSEYELKKKYYSQFVPEQMSEDEILEYIGKNCDKSLGKGGIMKTVIPQLRGKADGKTISSAVDRFLKN